MSEEQKKIKPIHGVFSSQEVRKVGTGTTTRKTVSKIYWFVEQIDDNTVSVQTINTNYIPTGTAKNITLEQLLSHYAPEPEFYVQSVYPKMQELNESIHKADESREKGELFTAEYEYERALKLDEDNVRANFGIGLTYLERGETEKADNIFDRLVNLDAAFEQKHKHLFNDFGINLRKNKMYDQAKAYYNRGLELTSLDENLHINIARVFLEQKDYTSCTEHLFQGLELSPQNNTIIQFLSWMHKKNLIPSEHQTRAQEIINTLQGPPNTTGNDSTP